MWVQNMPKPSLLDNCHYLTSLAVLWKTPFTGLVFIGPDLELALTISSCLTSQLPVSVITVGANKKLTKNLKEKKNLGNEIFKGSFDIFNIFLAIKYVMHMCRVAHLPKKHLRMSYSLTSGLTSKSGQAGNKD